jgi:hypothetical protein
MTGLEIAVAIIWGVAFLSMYAAMKKYRRIHR